jgi:hypothetical protein
MLISVRWCDRGAAPAPAHTIVEVFAMAQVDQDRQADGQTWDSLRREVEGIVCDEMAAG